MTALLTCLGEALIDFLPIEDAGHTVGFRMHAGGSLLNVAVAAARLGQPVTLAGRLSTDFFGRFLRGHMQAEGVDGRWLLDSPAQSTLAFVAKEDGEPAYSFYGDGAADTLLRPGELPDDLFAATGILHVGSISLLRGTTPEAVLDTVARLRGKALISCDPNLRPSLVRDEAAYRATLARLFAMADMIKLSSVDLGWLLPGHTPEQATAELLAHGPALVIVTMGGTGVLAARAPDGRALHASAFPITVADTVGAGDSFNGGMLTRLADLGVGSRAALEALSDDELTAALRFASAVAAINCTRPGADPPRRAEVDALLQAHP
jgi:fructokinase